MSKGKTCNGCGGLGPFGLRKGSKDGLKSRCKKCLADKQRQYAAANPHIWSNWAEANAAKLKAREVTRYAADPEAAKVRVLAWRLENPEKARTYEVTTKLRRYGLTLETFQAVFDGQDGKCAICKDPLKEGRTGVQVDHDHTTGKFRGLLCHMCNRALGHFKESPEILEAVVRYLVHYDARGPRQLVQRQKPTALLNGSKASNLWHLYRLTLEDFQQMLDSQGGACGICRDILDCGKHTHIDHNHSLARAQGVRGLLCRSCNFGLGQVRESHAIVSGVLDYLRTHRGPT